MNIKIIMYHPGRVLEVFSTKDKNIDATDGTTQAMLEMWDDNLITVLVETQLSAKVKKDDIVLVDYRPMQSQPVPKMTVIKILKGPVAKRTWSTYKDHHSKRKVVTTQGMKPKMPKQSYVG